MHVEEIVGDPWFGGHKSIILYKHLMACDARCDMSEKNLDIVCSTLYGEVSPKKTWFCFSPHILFLVLLDSYSAEVHISESLTN